MNERTATVLDRLHPAEREALAAFKAALAREFGGGFLKLVLFGSRARGEGCGWAICRKHQTEEGRLSDLDVVVFLRDASWENWRRVIHIGTEILGEHRVVLDPKCFTPEGWAEGLDRELLFYEEVERDGVEI